jgi:transcriptional regulator with XRE-family HTH domain
LDLSELKLVSASNIIKLRTAAGMTQAELGARLNYSDKTISKWERGEAIPDAYVLTQMADIFGVSVDYLLSSHDMWEEVKDENRPVEKQYSVELIMALTILSIWTAALAAFVTLWILDIIWWYVFLIALSVSLLVLIILLAVFKRRKYLEYFISAFVLSLFALLYFAFPDTTPWQIFLLTGPAVAIVFLACNLEKRPGKCKKIKNNKQK